LPTSALRGGFNWSLQHTVATLRVAAWPDWTIVFDTIVIEFVFGVILAMWTLRGHRLPRAMASAFLLGGLCIVLVLPMMSDAVRPLTCGIPAFAVVAGAVALEADLSPRLPKWLLALGDASYSIYVSHGFALPTVVYVASRVLGAGFLSQCVTVGLALVASAVVGWALFIIIERPITTFVRDAWLRRGTATADR
jgi:exopolysaccharide production protein ExoZ